MASSTKPKIHAVVSTRYSWAETACNRVVKKKLASKARAEVTCGVCKTALDRFQHTDSYTRRLADRRGLFPIYRYRVFCTCGWTVDGSNWMKNELKKKFIQHRVEAVRAAREERKNAGVRRLEVREHSSGA